MESNQIVCKSAIWQPKKLDLGLAVIIAILFPIVAGFLYGETGALLPMLLYYGLAWILVKFLTTVDSNQVFGVVFILLTSVSGFLHLVVWRKSNHMILTFIPHFLLNLVPIFWTNYSILPFLIR